MTPVVVLGGSAAALPVVRSLGRRGVPVTVVEIDRQGVAAYSRYVRDVQHVGSDLEVISYLRNRAYATSDPIVVIPTSDRFVECLRVHGEALEASLRFHRQRAGENLVSKIGLDAALARNGIEKPESWIPTGAEIGSTLDGLPLPVIVKPEFQRAWLDDVGFNGRFGFAKALLVSTRDELRECVSSVESLGRLVFQEYIPGPSAALHYFVGYRSADGRILASSVGRKLRTYPHLLGTEVLIESCFHPAVEALGEACMERLDLRGIAGIDIKLDERDSQPKVIEINHRFGTTDGLACAAGVDLPWINYRDLLSEPVGPRPSARLGIRWHWTRREIDWVRDYGRRERWTVIAELRDLLRFRHTWMLFDWRDPGVLLRRLFRSAL